MHEANQLVDLACAKLSELFNNAPVIRRDPENPDSPFEVHANSGKTLTGWYARTSSEPRLTFAVDGKLLVASTGLELLEIAQRYK